MTRHACACLGASACACILAIYILIGLGTRTDEEQGHRGDTLPTLFMAMAVLCFFAFFLLAYATCLFSARIWRRRRGDELLRPDDVLAVPLETTPPPPPERAPDVTRESL